GPRHVCDPDCCHTEDMRHADLTVASASADSLLLPGHSYLRLPTHAHAADGKLDALVDLFWLYLRRFFLVSGTVGPGQQSQIRCVPRALSDSGNVLLRDLQLDARDSSRIVYRGGPNSHPGFAAFPSLF